MSMTKREEVARAIWNIRREREDRCDMELEDMGNDHDVWDEADAAIAALAQPVAAEGWISVDERMPKAQAPVLLDIGGKHPIRAMWVEAKSLPVGVDDANDFGEYDELADEWYCPAGWYEWNQYEECHWLVHAKPLNWRYLPHPPTSPTGE
jgi:hypothetical protein